MTSSHENEYDYAERLTPTEKLLTADRLTYLPNLYYRQYKLTESLSQLRVDFPQHKVLLPRDPTNHDLLLQEAKEAQFVLFQDIKYRKVRNFQIVKSMKKQSAKLALKKQEKLMFHRVTYSYLAEAVKEKFQKTQAVEKQVEGEKPNHFMERKRSNDDIFLHSESDRDEQLNEDNFLDDILQENPIQNIHNEEDQVQKQAVIQPVINHIQEVVKFQQVDYNFVPINRKQCLRKINQNLRKRIKNKGNSEDVPQRNLNSATVAITTIINSEPEPKIEQAIEFESVFDSIFQTQNKQKKRKEQIFDLKWADEELQKFQELNGKIDLGKEKFDPNYLLLELEKNDTEFEKCFDKNIKAKKNFPPSIKQIPSLDSKFKKRYFYNEFTDREYEEFLMKHNKKTIMDKFAKSAPYIFSDSLPSDYDSHNINVAKMFLNQDSLQNDRMIYKINSRKMAPTSSLQHRSIFSEEQLLQLSFLVRKYLGLFGNNWKLISSFVSTHPAFSQMNLTVQQIQEYHQLVRQSQQTNGELLRFWNSRILPFQVYNGSIYQEYQPNQKVEVPFEDETFDKMDIQTPDPTDFELSNFQKLISQPLNEEQSEKPYSFNKTNENFHKFAKSIHFSEPVHDKFTLSDHLKDVSESFQSKEGETKFHHQKLTSDKGKNAYEIVLQGLSNEKSQIKISYPFRKRKNINEKTSQLVKILQQLKNKTVGGPKPNPQNPQKPGVAVQPPPLATKPSTQEPKKQQPKSTKATSLSTSKVQKQPPQQPPQSSADKKGPLKQAPRKKKKGDNDDK